MVTAHLPESGYLTRMADGTIKQINPFTGTQVWTVPGRGNRPLGVRPDDPRPLTEADRTAGCAFCSDRYLQTPPEKARLVTGERGWELLRRLPAEDLFASIAEFRRIPNLFEILSYDYWRANYGYELPTEVRERQEAYLAAPQGLEHVLAVVRQKLRAGGASDEAIAELGQGELLARASGFFGGGHDVIVARRHYTDDATDTSGLASSGTLTPEEHFHFVDFTVDAIRELYRLNRYARYVAVFQNWLKPAGASFDHLHKQLVAIDERGVQTELELARLRQNPNLYNEAAVNHAGYQNLVIAENEHAIAFAGFGHRYPTLEVYSRSATARPWEQTPDELRAMSDLLHACHAATGPHVPCNEEWHHQPADVDQPMPWRIVLKWRVSTLAGFEGGTKINVNTIDPWTLRDRVVPELFRLREQGRIADMRIATECECRPNPLRYNALLR